MKKNAQELLLLILLVVVFIAVRSINYVYFLNWSGDQASCGIEALRIWQTKTPTLIGPQISANLNGRFIFQGPIIYYLFLFFLVLGQWNPIASSYLFMISAALMIIPLYFGMKKLVNEKGAWLMVIFYSLLPYYLNYTRFLWNSTFQFSLLPVLVLLMGWFKQKKTGRIFFVLSICLGILLQFHYQFILVIAGFFIYYFLIKKLNYRYLLLFIIGNGIGFSPLIIFEFKHHFYNLKTIWLFINNWSGLDRPGGVSTPHYYLSLSFFSIIVAINYLGKLIKKIPYFYILILASILIGYGLFLNVPRPVHAFWAPTTPWNYLVEEKIYNIIQSTKLTSDFNIANLAYYDTKSVVVKYFMKKDGYLINYDDYYNNKYLFVITEGNKYLNNPAYEVSTFKPNKLLNKWKINDRFDMILLERLPKQ